MYIIHVLREGNEVANFCAMVALDKDLSFHVLSDIQPELEVILQNDSRELNESEIVKSKLLFFILPKKNYIKI